MQNSVTLPVVQLVHHILGRVRLRVHGLVQYPHDATELVSVLGRIPGVTNVRINYAAQSLVLQYQTRFPARVGVDQPIDQFLETQVSQCLLAYLQDRLQRRSGTTAPSTDNLTDNLDESANDYDSLVPFLSSPTPPEPPSADEGQWSSLQLPITAAVLASVSRLSRLGFLRPIAAIALLASALPVAQRAFHSLVMQRRFNIDCLDLLALGLSGWQGQLFTPAMVITLHALGDVIREQTARSTEVRTTNLMDTIGHLAWVKVGDHPPQQVPSDHVQVGDLVVVYPGEQIPVDGLVVQGDAIVDQQSLTGEAMPVVRQVGQWVFASTLVRSGQLYLHAERVGRQTRAAASIELLQKAPVYDTRMANYTEKVADRLILPALFLASIVLLATRDPARAAAILTLDFVTGIRVSIPTAFLSALNHTTRHGVLVRSGRTLEQLAEVDTIVFDKTGTLTQGTIAITGVTTVEDGLTTERILQLAAAAEQRLNHPVAAAIVQYTQQHDLEIPARQEWGYEVGLGIRAQIDGQEVLVGSERFLHQAGIDWGTWQLHPDYQRQSLIYVACDRRFQGVIHYADPLRPESRQLIQTLQHDYGIDLHLLTGDHVQRATQVAHDLGIPTSRVYAEAFPEHKARVVRENL